MKYIYRVDWKTGGHCLLKVKDSGHLAEIIDTYAMRGQFSKISLIKMVRK